MEFEDFTALASALERRQSEAMVELAAESSPVAGGWMTYGGRGAFVNKACGLGLSGPVTLAEVDQVVTYFASRGVEPKVELCPFVDPSLLQGLAGRAFRLQEFENVLIRPLTSGEDFRARMPHPWPAGLEIERVDPADGAAVAKFIEVSASGFFPVGHELFESLRRFSQQAVGQPGQDSLVARIDAQVVGAAACASGGGITALFGASVLRGFRQRGVQQALIAARLEHARARGSSLATIVSHPGIPTERNAARLGFQMAYTRAVLVKPGAGLVPSP